MRFPSFIQKGDTIGFAAPAFGCAAEPYYTAFLNARKKIKEKGYGEKPGPNCLADEGIGISNTPEKCAEELMDMYEDREVDCILSCGGGELMCEVVSFLDFERLSKDEPKWFLGYSDNTNMTFLLATLADTASIYGPCVGAFGMEPWHPAIEDAWLLLNGEKLRFSNYPKWEIESLKDETHPLEPYHVTEPFRIRTYQAGDGDVVRGRLIGGCLDCLANLVGTRFDRVKEFAETYREDGLIWFMEACDLNVMSIRRTLWNLKEAGWFRYARAFLIGRPMHYDEPMMGLDQYQAVTGILGDFGVPIYMDLDIGHTAPMMPLVCGSYASVCATGNQFIIEMELKP